MTDKAKKAQLEICPKCDGSGVGVADTTCALCDGSGGVPAESPEARVLEPCPFCGNDDPLCYPVEKGSKIYRGGCDNADCILFDDFPGNYTSQEHFAQWWNTRAASTARPTERGAVEEDLCRKDGQPCYVGRGTDDAHHRCGTVQCGMRKADPATDQAAEVERLREALKPFAVEADEQERVTSFRDGDCVIPRTKITIGQLRRARAALATQPATGRTMGGEDGLREALTPYGETEDAYTGEFSWTEWVADDEGLDQGYERVVPWDTIKEIMAAIRHRAGVDVLDESDCYAALQNGGE